MEFFTVERYLDNQKETENGTIFFGESVYADETLGNILAGCKSPTSR
jgi:hypothetical protein